MCQSHGPDFLTRVVHHLFTAIPSRWKRQRLLGPRQVLVCVMHLSVLGKRTYKTLLRELHESMHAALEWPSSPSAAALSQARKKLSKEVCRRAFQDIAAFCTQGLPSSIRYGDYRILASDATKVELPSSKALRQRFGRPHTHAVSGVPQALLTVMWDVSRNRPVDWCLDRWRSSERNAAFSMFRHLGPGDVLVADRGNPSRRVFIDINKRQSHFLMRVGSQHKAYREVTEFLASGKDDAVIDLSLRIASQRLAHGGSTIPIRLIRLSLPDGTDAVFATNFLDQDLHPRQQLLDLYTKRWRIETVFRDMKLGHGLEVMRSRSVRGIHQEIAGIMLYMLMASEFDAMARLRLGIPQHNPSPEQPNQVQDCGVRLNHRLLIHTVARTFAVAVSDPGKLEKRISEDLEYLWKYRSAVRPHRSFPRIAKSPNSLWRGGRPGGRA